LAQPFDGELHELSVCVVAQYPWPRISDLATSEPPGAILCSDTRLSTSSGKAFAAFWSKTEPLGHNIVVSFTSNNAAATVWGLEKVKKEWRPNRVAESLRTAHSKYGGFSEILAVVSRKGQAPAILELMPPDYQPKVRHGIVGIGHRGVLDWIRQNGSDDVPPEKRWTPPAEVVESLARTVGHPVSFRAPSFTIEQAAMHVAAPMSEAIRLAGDATVALPLQVVTVSDGVARTLSITSSADMQTFEDVTIERDKVRLIRPQPPIVAPFHGRRKATQLFD
jgi:hypothetical protein